MPAKDKTGKSQGDAECCICTNWKLRTLKILSLLFRREKNFAERLRKGWRLKIPGSHHFDEVDVGGADDDGGPDGGHAQPVVDSRIAEVDHQVIVPLQQPHREARLKQSLSINPHIFSLVLSFTTRTQTNNMGTQIWVQITSRDWLITFDSVSVYFRAKSWTLQACPIIRWSFNQKPVSTRGWSLEL